jgi:hypothetical protein
MSQMTDVTDKTGTKFSRKQKKYGDLRENFGKNLIFAKQLL